MTLSALQKLFFLRDSRIESLMVIGYNPSHSNINSEVNAPFKILSTLLRFVENEKTGGKYTGGPIDLDLYEESANSFGNYQMQRADNRVIGHERLDTMEGQNDLYYDEEDEEGEFLEEGQEEEKLDTSQEKIEVNLDDIEDGRTMMTKSACLTTSRTRQTRKRRTH